MSEYTPSPQAVRAVYAHSGAWRQSEIDEQAADFDRFLDAVKADAWDHAIEHVSQLEADTDFMDHYKPHNPYRDQEEV